MCITRVKLNSSINNFKNVNLPFLQGIRFNLSPFAPTITKAGIREINIREKSIFRTFRNNIANSSVRNDT